MAMEQLEDLWTTITNSTLPRKSPEVQEKLDHCQLVLLSGLTSFTRLPKKTATSLTSDDVLRTLRGAKRKHLAEEFQEDEARILTVIIHTLYLDILSAAKLLEKTAEAQGKSVATLTRLSTGSATEIALKFYFQQRRLILAVHAYIQETLRSFGSIATHPFERLFVNFADEVRASDFIPDLLEEFSFTLSLLKDYVDNPSFDLQKTWLSLQLQDFRDVLLLLLHLSSQLPKTKPTLELIIRPLITAGQCLQKFPVSSDPVTGPVQLELVQQGSQAVTVFAFVYFSLGVQVFLRDDDAVEYLNEALPTGSSLLAASPASVLWFVSHLEADSQNQRSLECLDKCLNSVNPFLVLTSVIASDVLVLSAKEILSGAVFDFCEQFIRLFGVDSLGQLSGSVYSLAVEIFRNSKEAIRFWQRWTEGAGTDVNFGWGLLFAVGRDALPVSFGTFVPFATGLLKGLPVGSAAVSQLDKMLWNLDSFSEVVAADGFKNITLVQAQAENLSAVRTDMKRLPYGTDALVIPAGTYGYMVNLGAQVQFKWILHKTGSFSIWTICAVRLNEVLSDWKENFTEAFDTVDGICGFYCAAMTACSATHGDLQEVLQLLCRALGCLFHACFNSVEQSANQLHAVVQLIFDVCAVEVPFCGTQFVRDFDLLAPVFPKAVHITASDLDWIRNGDLTWFSVPWQTLCQKSTQHAFVKTLNKLADVQRRCASIPGDSDTVLHQSSLFTLNIGLQFLAQLSDPSDGIEILKYSLAVLADDRESSGPTLSTIATDCMLEGPAGQALVELLNSSNRTLGLLMRNLCPTAVEDLSARRQVHFVRAVLETIHIILELLPVRPSTCVTSFERALLTVEKTRQMESISVSTGDTHHKHPVLQLMRLITQAKDAKIVEFATKIISRLIVLQQPSLMTIAKEDAEDFLKSVFWLLQEANEDVAVQLWKFLALCDSRQPRLLDLFINLVFKPESKKFVVDIDNLPSLLDVFLETISNASAKTAMSGAFGFCLEIFSSKNDYVEYLSLNNRFWRSVFEALHDIPQASIGWEKKLSSVYALDLIGLAAGRSLKSSLFSEEVMESEWTNYVTYLLPKIFVHLNKDIPKMLHALEEDSDAVKVLTRFFVSWSSMHLLTFRMEKLEPVVTDETRLNIIRTLFVLLNRSLLSSSGGVFVQAVAAALTEFLHSWRRNLSVQFFSSIFHVVEEFTVLVCGVFERENWTDLARHAILSVSLTVLDLTVQFQSEKEKPKAKLPVARLQNVMKAAVEVVGYSSLTWDPRDEKQDSRGVMLGYAVGVVKNCVRLTLEDSGAGGHGMRDIREVFSGNCLYEILLTKVVQLVSAHRLPQVTQNFMGLILLMSQDEESAATINAAGFSSCLSLPLAGSIVKFKELFTERDVQTASIEDVVASKERSVEAQDIFEVYLTALAVEFNIIRADRFRFADALKFIGTQLTCIPEVLKALQEIPTMFTFRLIEMLTRLKAEAVRHPMSSTMKQNCLADIPAIFHAMCSQIMRRSDKLIEEPENLATPTMELVMSTALNCLQVLNSANPGLAVLLTEDEFAAESSTVKVIVEYSFANPASASLSPDLSFGTFVHVIKTGVEILSKENVVMMESIIFSSSRQSVTTITKLVDFVERSTHFFMFQAMAFAVGLTDLTGEKWQETLRELTNEIVDLRHILHNFLTTLEGAIEPNSPTESTNKTSLLSLLADNMLGFRNFYDDTKDDLVETRSYQSLATLNTSLKTVDRKRVTFML